MVEFQPSKLVAWVRFPSLAPKVRAHSSVDRVPGYEPVGRRFESSWARQKSLSEPLWFAKAFFIPEDSKGKRYRADFRWTSATVEDRARSRARIESSWARQQKRNFCLSRVPFLLSKPQAWYIIRRKSAYH